MSQSREWKTIKEYQDILFEFYKGIDYHQPPEIPQCVHSDHYY